MKKVGLGLECLEREKGREGERGKGRKWEGGSAHHPFLCSVCSPLSAPTGLTLTGISHLFCSASGFTVFHSGAIYHSKVKYGEETCFLLSTGKRVGMKGEERKRKLSEGEALLSRPINIFVLFGSNLRFIEE